MSKVRSSRPRANRRPRWLDRFKDPVVFAALVGGVCAIVAGVVTLLKADPPPSVTIVPSLVKKDSVRADTIRNLTLVQFALSQRGSHFMRALNEEECSGCAFVEGESDAYDTRYEAVQRSKRKYDFRTNYWYAPTEEWLELADSLEDDFGEPVKISKREERRITAKLNPIFDVTVRNDGSLPAYVTGVRFRLLRALELTMDQGDGMDHRPEAYVVPLLNRFVIALGDFENLKAEDEQQDDGDELPPEDKRWIESELIPLVVPPGEPARFQIVFTTAREGMFTFELMLELLAKDHPPLPLQRFRLTF